MRRIYNSVIISIAFLTFSMLLYNFGIFYPPSFRIISALCNTTLACASFTIIPIMWDSFIPTRRVRITTADIVILNAPTGIGKTKFFLDLLDKYRQKRKFERVFYFSPLLALTEDFEKKLARTTTNQEDILIYNHIFSGSLLEKEERTQRESGLFDLYHWYFKYESFNKKFIITTTQRLLITLYSNKASDKLKLLSMKNSILILDEIQTLPKFLIPNLIEMLQELTKSMKSKVLLVSATIPHELSSLPKIEISPKIRMDYLRRTQKKILFIGNSFSIPDFHGKKILLMSNTRRKAREMFRKVEDSYRPQSESK